MSNNMANLLKGLYRMMSVRAETLKYIIFIYSEKILFIFTFFLKQCSIDENKKYIGLIRPSHTVEIESVLSLR